MTKEVFWHNVPYYDGYELDEIMSYIEEYKVMQGCWESDDHEPAEEISLDVDFVDLMVKYLKKLASQNPDSVYYPDGEFHPEKHEKYGIDI